MIRALRLVLPRPTWPMLGLLLFAIWYQWREINRLRREVHKISPRVNVSRETPSGPFPTAVRGSIYAVPRRA